MAITLHDITLQGASTFLMTLGTGWIIFIVSKSLPAYLAEKSKNLATKEDIHHLTATVEKVRAQFSHINTVQRVQFEAEFEAYKALWVAGQTAVVAYIRWMSLSTSSEDGMQKKYVESQFALSEAVVIYQPFIPDSVHATFKVLEELILEPKYDDHLRHPRMPADHSKERKAIYEAQRLCGEAIKSRLEEVRVV